MRRYSPPPASAPRIFLRRIPKGYAGTMRTASHVKRLIREGAKDFYVRQKAIDILLERRVRPKHYLGEIAALFEWVQRNVRYTKDPYPGRSAAHAAADARAPGRRLRRHDHPARLDAGVDGASGASRDHRAERAAAAILQSHLPRSQPPRAVDPVRRHHAASPGMVAPRTGQTDHRDSGGAVPCQPCRRRPTGCGD